MENQGIVSNSAAVAAAMTDYSPAQVVIPPFTLNLGTRIRLRAFGSYVTSAATATPTFGFYMTNAGTALTAASSLPLAATGAVTVASTGSVAWPWRMEWDGHVRVLSTPTTNAQYFGHGLFYNAGASLITIAAPIPIPISVALRTVTQVAGGGNTNQGQMLSVGIFPNVTTALATITCDDFTCELLG
jgi:hypothetical protein